MRKARMRGCAESGYWAWWLLKMRRGEGAMRRRNVDAWMRGIEVLGVVASQDAEGRRGDEATRR
jgi:hypothetical protein